jgi:carbonic anhydrase/acetyltransferase-like protein (isoleucine patch superfamily)
MILPYNDTYPDIADDAFIAPTATIIGDVKIASGASIWYGTVLRGDMAPIRIGKDSNIQDNCTIHTDQGQPAIIGSRVTVGHNAIVHGCIVEDSCLIGMNAVVLSGAHIKTVTIIAAGAVIKEGQVAGPFQLLAGMPAVVKKNLSEESIDLVNLPSMEYLELARDHKAALSDLSEVRK